MAMATTMYHTEKNPLKKVLGGKAESVQVVRQGRTRRLHKAFLRYHDAENWPLLREALKEMGREDLIGNSKKHLIPLYQPAGTGKQPEGTRAPRAETSRGKPGGVKAGQHKPGTTKPGSARTAQAQPGSVRPGAAKASSVKPNSVKPGAAKARPAQPGSANPAAGKPASRNRPAQVPKHPLSQRRGGGKSH